jgi:hypothetical protein
MYGLVCQPLQTANTPEFVNNSEFADSAAFSLTDESAPHFLSLKQGGIMRALGDLERGN